MFQNYLRNCDAIAILDGLLLMQLSPWFAFVLSNTESSFQLRLFHLFASPGKFSFPQKLKDTAEKSLFKNWQKEMISLRKEEQKTMFLKVTARASRAEEEDCLEPEIFAEQQSVF